ncbi:MAG: anthranilate synthase component I [Anaerolineae bacterium]|nr:anthranilate synthase component I [Anaerolineae bacterium]MDW8298963.1 anthranilate synthase component I [Anaerolineae bacterium]
MTATAVTFRAAPPRLYSLTFEEVRDLFAQGDLVPIYRALPADLETPVTVYLKLAQSDEPSFLLESVEGGEQVARYSFLGVNPSAVLTVRGRELTERRGNYVTQRPLRADQDPLDVIKAAIGSTKPVSLPALPRFIGGAVGFLSYDIVRHFERLPATAIDELDLPDLGMMLVDTLVIFDHVKHQVLVLANARNTGDPRAAYDDAINRIETIVARLKQPLPDLPAARSLTETPSLVANFTQVEFERLVLRAKDYIAAGDAFQIVLSQRFTRETDAHPFSIYRALRMLNPSPYMFFLRFPSEDLHVIGASPEMLVRFDAPTRTAAIRPIAGTAPRDPDHTADEANARKLLSDPKERAEHVMLVDLARNDLGRVCDFGTVRVPQMMFIERFSHVMHITSHVEGKLRADLDAYALFRAAFPAGTLTGAPKIRAMEIIEELEGTRRSIYGGAIGYFSYDGSMDACIAIRTLVMRGKRVYLQAGAGVVADSEPAKEYQETINKARAVAIAIENAERGLI